MKDLTKIMACCFLLITAAGCKKEFLDVKPNKSLLVPQTADDLWALLDNNFVFNNSPALTTLADGDSYTTDAGYNSYLIDEERKSYTWSADIFGGATEPDWNIPYQQVFYSNVVLEAAEKLSTGEVPVQTINAIRGTALFHRAFAYYDLAQEFAPQYHAANAAASLGVPLRNTSDVNVRSARASLADTYAQIIADLKQARMLLPGTSAAKTRPVTAAAFGMLSKTYLAMEDYANAGKYADSCLQLNNTLFNFNTLSTTSTRPFPKALPGNNDEIIFYSLAISYDFQGSSSPTVCDPALYASYASNDLRKVIFYRALSPGFKFKGNYAGILSIFSGLAVDEMLLTRAECYARAGSTDLAMNDLNTLLVKRWKTGTYQNLTAPTGDAALALVLTERRKELTNRGTRWSDLKRLNTDSRFAVTLSRTVAGSVFTLTPDSKRYVYPIPQDELVLNGLVQNDR